MSKLIMLIAITLTFVYPGTVNAQLSILSRSPNTHSYSATQSNRIEIVFDRDIAAANLQSSITVHSTMRGRINGVASISPTNSRLVLFTPSENYLFGDRISVVVSTALSASDGSRLSTPQSWSFNVRSLSGSLAFTQKMMYVLRTGSEPSKLAPVDLNDDGAPDLVVINSNNSLISIFENRFRTTNNLSLVREITIPPAPNKVSFDQDLVSLASVITADLNNNGLSDVIILSPRDNRVVILRNTTGQISGITVSLIDTGERPVSVAAGDFNGDGFLDLAIATLGNDQVYVHINDGSGSFLIPQVIPVGRTPTSVVVTDINGDQTSDIVVLCTGDRRVVGLENNGNASFTIRNYISNLNFSPTFMLLAPVIINNGNRLPDIILGVSDQVYVTLYENIGNVFRLQGNRTLGNVSRPTEGILSDLDADGIPELVTSHFTTDRVTIARMTGNGLSGLVTSVDRDPIPQPFGLATADFNGSGAMDMAVANAGKNQITIYLNASFGDCQSIVGGLQYPSTVDFGIVEKGVLAKRTFSIANQSNSEFEIQLNVSRGTFFSLTTNQLISLIAGATRENEVTFQAQDPGVYTDEILLTLNSVCGVQQRIIEMTAQIQPDKPDLEAVSLEKISLANDYLLGTTHVFEGVARLNGELPVTEPFRISFLINNEEFYTETIATPLQLGQSRAFQFTHTFTQPGVNSIVFFVDSGEVVDESNETNNQKTFNVTVREGLFTVSPNPFTPNNDGYNDAVIFNFSQIFNVSAPRVTIFSFEGQSIRTFTSQDMINGLITWDGRDANGKLLKPGVYLYAALIDGKMLSRGSLTLAL